MSATAAIRTAPEVITKNQQPQNWQDLVEKQVGALRFGSVEITVHEGRVVQIETSVKVRFDKTA